MPDIQQQGAEGKGVRRTGRCQISVEGGKTIAARIGIGLRHDACETGAGTVCRRPAVYGYMGRESCTHRFDPRGPHPSQGRNPDRVKEKTGVGCSESI